MDEADQWSVVHSWVAVYTHIHTRMIAHNNSNNNNNMWLHNVNHTSDIENQASCRRAVPQCGPVCCTRPTYPVSPSAMHGIGGTFSSSAAFDRPSDTDVAAETISP